MRKAFASLLGATVLVVVAAACANSTADLGDDTSGTDADSGASTKPSPSSSGTSNTFSDSGSGNQQSTDSGSSSSKDSGSGNTGTDSGSGSTGTDSGSTGTGEGTLCDLSGTANVILYTGEYLGENDPASCPCGAGQCCYDNGVYPPGCVSQ